MLTSLKTADQVKSKRNRKQALLIEKERHGYDKTSSIQRRTGRSYTSHEVKGKVYKGKSVICILVVGKTSPVEWLPKVQTNGRHVSVDGALIVVESTFAKAFDLCILIVRCLT